MQKSKQTWRCEAVFRKTFFPPNLVNCLRSQILLPSKTSLFLAVSKEKHYFKPIYWNFNRNICDVDVAIDPCQAKQQQGIRSLQVFFVHFTRPALPSVTYGTIRLSLILLTTTKIKKTLLGAHLERCKGRFVSKGNLSAVRNLAKGKDNLKRPVAEEHNGEKDYEPTEKKETLSKQVCFSYRGKLLQMLQSGSHFYTLIRHR